MSAEKTLPTASAWSELCWFIECPHCSHLEDLGADVSWNAGDAGACEGCGELFAYPEQQDPNDLSRHCVRGAP